MLVVLSIAGFDPSGGAGVLADIKTFSAFGCFGTAAISSLTSQNTMAVYGAVHQSAETLRAQIEPVANDFQIAAVKTGMLPTRETIEVTAELIELLSNEKKVTEQTPPAFVVHPTNDRVVPVDNARMFVEAMKAKNVPVEYLETPTGDHGMGLGKGALWAEWQTAAVKWMAGRGVMK